MRVIPRPVTCRLGLLLVAHRYESESASHLRTLALAAGVPGRLATIGHRSADEIETGLRSLHAAGLDGVAVVPLFVSSESRLIRQAAELDAAAAAAAGFAVVVTSALDESSEVMDALADRARRLAEARGHQALMLVGHGPVGDEDMSAWEALGATVAAGVLERTGFAAAEAGVVRDDAPSDTRAAAVRILRERIEQLAADTGRPVVVVPWIVGAGRLTRERLPQDLAGLDVRYDGRPLLPHPALARWVTRQLAGARSLLDRGGGDPAEAGPRPPSVAQAT
jgi:sirohydrochlorin ferrochelatase